ncbi:helicase [Jeotgalibacillus proteolyticus]|uniref:Helicase n=1 Tax=Jeotgalibacillus proteolyticus TaxID=2082395 RepID=A0A2S5GDW6_9BACL|nr:helicase [Jeotgalibacillus proteolyticus]PPA71083.1 helicase [Jeotgalibacillus proteolyticus]
MENKQAFITRTVSIGGLSKEELTRELKDAQIMMNEYGERLFDYRAFELSREKYSLNTIEMTVKDLGFRNGATSAEIFKKAIESGLKLCPLELGPYLRLHYLDQPEDRAKALTKQHQAPSGSITLASKVIIEDDTFPKGFYLRKADGVLWLRGYAADHLHVWNPEDHFIFCQ